MSLAGVERLLEAAPSFARALDAAIADAEFAAPEALRPALIAGLLRRRRAAGDHGPLLLIAATSREAESLRAALASLVPEAVTAESVSYTHLTLPTN